MPNLHPTCTRSSSYFLLQCLTLLIFDSFRRPTSTPIFLTPSLVQEQNLDRSFIGKTGGEIFHEMMLRQRVKHIFGYPGGAILPVFDAILQLSPLQVHSPSTRTGCRPHGRVLCPCKMPSAMASPSSSSPVKSPPQPSVLMLSKRLMLSVSQEVAQNGMSWSKISLNSLEESTKRLRSLPRDVLVLFWPTSPRTSPQVSSVRPFPLRLQLQVGP